MSDVELIELCKLGDIEALKTLYETNYKKVYFYSKKITGKAELCDDIVSEVFLQCFKWIKTLKDPSLFDAWFYKIIFRVSCKIAKKDTQKKHIEGENFFDIEENTRDNFDTHKHFEYLEIQQVIKKTIEKLCVEQRMTVVLFYLNHLSIREISEYMSCLEATVKSRLFLARKKIQRDLVKSGYAGNDTSLDIKLS